MVKRIPPQFDPGKISVCHKSWFRTFYMLISVQQQCSLLELKEEPITVRYSEFKGGLYDKKLQNTS